MLQMERIKNREPHSRLYFLKVVILEGYEDFVSVHYLGV